MSLYREIAKQQSTEHARTIWAYMVDGTPFPSDPIHWRAGTLTHDRCETCDLLLFAHERREVTSTFEVRDDTPGMGGLGLITATYCPTHAPKEAA